MTSIYHPYSPQGVPVEVAKDIWTIEGGVVQYAIGPVKVPCPTRMTVLHDGAGGLLLHSPVELSSQLVDALAEIGTVAYLMAPNSFHYLHLNAWAEAFPLAEVLVAPAIPSHASLPERAQIIRREPSNRLKNVVDCIEVDGGSWVELALLHRPSRTLILTDLIQNFETGRMQGVLAKALLTIGGATGQPPSASIEMRLAALLHRKKKGIRKSFQAIKDWRPERILIAHGASLSGPPHHILHQAFNWA